MDYLDHDIKDYTITKAQARYQWSGTSNCLSKERRVFTIIHSASASQLGSYFKPSPSTAPARSYTKISPTPPLP